MKRKKKKRKDLLADLDWWSKYYVTKEDFDKVLIGSDIENVIIIIS